MHCCTCDLLKLFKLTVKKTQLICKKSSLMRVSCFVFRNVHASRDCTLFSLGEKVLE